MQFNFGGNPTLPPNIEASPTYPHKPRKLSHTKNLKIFVTPLLLYIILKKIVDQLYWLFSVIVYTIHFIRLKSKHYGIYIS